MLATRTEFKLVSDTEFILVSDTEFVLVSDTEVVLVPELARMFLVVTIGKFFFNINSFHSNNVPLVYISRNGYI